MKSIVNAKSVPLLIAIGLLGGCFTGGMAFAVQGNAFGFENVPIIAVVPAFLVGVTSALVISVLVIRNRNILLDRIKAEQEISLALRQEIAERKRTEEKLVQAQKMESVGQLTGGVAHDFNNLLAIIMGNAELLSMAGGNADRFVEPIMRAATRGAELTQRLLAFSRQQALRPRPIDLARLAGDMSELLRRTLGETIDVEIATPPGLWHAIADPGQVENALLNLAINARDAMPRGGKLTIECYNARFDDAYIAETPEVEPGSYAVLAVSDTGTGMSEDVLNHAFEPFFTTKEVGKGSGLGLSMVYGFAKQSGGHVAIYSEEGKGTTVKLYLPRTDAAPAAAAAENDIGIPRGQGECILVLEDEAEVRATALGLLEGLGYRVIGAPDAAMARDVLNTEPAVALLLSDVVLAGKTSGPEFAKQAADLYSDLKVILMSGYPADAARRNGCLGSDRVLLNKPFQIRELATALRDALEA